MSGAWRLGCPATDVHRCLERRLDEVTRNTRVAVYGGFLGVLVPTLLGWGIANLFGMDNTVVLFLSLTYVVTSVSISAHTLMQTKLIKTSFNPHTTTSAGTLGGVIHENHRAEPER